MWAWFVLRGVVLCAILTLSSVYNFASDKMATAVLCVLAALVLVSLYGEGVGASWASSPPISVRLKAQWSRTPLLLEAR